MEKKNEICCPFIPRHNSLRKTCAEIVSEARQSLRVQSTQRPFTPRDVHRQLFRRNSLLADHDTRPPSTFSLHAQNFDASNSRPGSGTRLSPLDHKPKYPVHSNADDPFKVFPKPPTDPLELRRGLAGARPRLLKTGSLTSLPSVEANKDVKERLNQGPGQSHLLALHLSSADHSDSAVHSGLLKPGPSRTASESRIVQPVDSDVRATECREERRTDIAECPTLIGMLLLWAQFPPWQATSQQLRELLVCATTASCITPSKGLCKYSKKELGYRHNTTSTEQDTASLVWNNAIFPLLQELESVAAGGSEGSVDRLCDLCDRLHGTLADTDMLGRRCKRRSGILRTLFRLIDLNSAHLNLHIAKLCLALCVSGKNLLNICKLIFQISRSENNDILFNSSVIDSLLGVLSKEDVCVSGEALLYCVGTLKFISGNSTILRLLLDKNCIGVAQKLIQKFCEVEDTNFTIAGHILLQLTATLRNLADHPDSRSLFVSFSILPALCVVLRHHCRDRDICTNISRIYSKLSSYSVCCLALAETHECYPLFLELLGKHHQKQDLVVRLLYTLGNLTSKSDEPRLELYRCEGCMEMLLQIYNTYQRKDMLPHTPMQKGAPFSSDSAIPPINAEEADDVLVKLVRVLANMCIHPAVGPLLATNITCIQLLMETLELRSVQESKELMVNVAATINNLSFYQEENSEIRRNRLAIAKLMLKLVLSSCMDVNLEAARVYGNLSQYKDVRDFIMQNKVYQFVVMLLDSKSNEMCFSACGVLTNLAVDPPNRICLTLEGATAKLVDCLRDFGPGDWQLAGQACQAVWNLTGGSMKLLEAQERETLLEILTTYLDEEEALKWIENDEARSFHRTCWELQFLPSAQKLVQGFSSHQT